MIDLAGKVLIELRDDSAFAVWHGGRVRVEEPMPPTATDRGDVRGSGEYVRFVVITPVVTPREKRVPVQRPRYGINVYGTSPQDAWAGYMLASDAIHEAGVRMVGSGATRTGIWNSWDDSGGSPERDPDTGQPFVTFVVELIAASQGVAA